MRRLSVPIRRPTHLTQLQFGATEIDLGPTFADQVMLEILGVRDYTLVQPWAEQMSDTTWAEKDPKEQYCLYPTTQKEVDSARQGASGQDVPVMGILMSDRPATLEAIDRELFSTPYLRESSLAVFRVSDTATPPRIHWLVLCRHRDTLPVSEQEGGGGGQIQDAATRLGGTLVYPKRMSITTLVKKPGVAFNAALTSQLAIPAVPVVSASPAASTSTALSVDERKKRVAFGLVGFGVLAAIGVWVWWRSKR